MGLVAAISEHRFPQPGAIYRRGGLVLAGLALALVGLACAGDPAARPAPEPVRSEAAAPAVTTETRAGMVALGERDALRRFFKMMAARNPNQLFATRVMGTRALTLDSPTRDGRLAIWVRQRCHYRIPLDEPPVETELPCVFACQYPRDADDTVDALGCSFRVP